MNSSILAIAELMLRYFRNKRQFMMTLIPSLQSGFQNSQIA